MCFFQADNTSKKKKEPILLFLQNSTLIELFRSFFGSIRGQQKVLSKLTDLQYSNSGGKQGSRNSTVSKQSIISCGCIVVWGKLIMEFKKDKGGNFWEIVYSTQWCSLLTHCCSKEKVNGKKQSKFKFHLQGLLGTSSMSKQETFFL